MDKIIYDALCMEKERQENNIELIASENYVSKDILELDGSILTNKYAEGYPNKRYYGGCKYVDIIESTTIDYACKLFKCKYANVQPHSGSSANMAVYRALLNHGDKVMGMNLKDGGHLTHGSKKSFSGIDYEIVSYELNPETGLIDYDEVMKLAIKEKPKMIIAGASSYSREIDFKKFREIADKVGAYLMVDMAHIAGEVAAGLHMSPIPYADIVTSTTHKTLRGPRGGIILTNNPEIAKKVDKAVFPMIQGGPLMHIIAAKAIAFNEALQPSFIEYQRQILKNSKYLAKCLIEKGYKLVSNGTDNHLMLVDVKSSVGLTGKEAEKLLDKVNITCNKNTIPKDTESPFVTSGIRIGTPALTTRKMKEKEMGEIADLIDQVLRNPNDEKIKQKVRKRVRKLTRKYKVK